MKNSMRSALVLMAVVIVTIAASTITYFYQSYMKEQRSTTFEVVEITPNYIVLKNNGTNVATNLRANRPMVFDPPTVAPGETTKGKFKRKLYGYTVIIIRSDEGTKFEYAYGEPFEAEQQQEFELF
jgi:hypothetical protein